MVDEQNLFCEAVHEVKIILLWQKKTKKDTWHCG